MGPSYLMAFSGIPLPPLPLGATVGGNGFGGGGGGSFVVGPGNTPLVIAGGPVVAAVAAVDVVDMIFGSHNISVQLAGS